MDASGTNSDFARSAVGDRWEKKGRVLEACNETQHAVKKGRRARYVRRAERTGKGKKGTVRGREELAVAVLATVGVSGQRVDNEQ